jgi:hypothetical protein
MNRPVNLKHYKQFWNHFIARFESEVSPMPRVMTSERAIGIFDEWFGFTVTIPQYAEIGMVEMDEENYAWFLLKWSNQ